MGDFRVEHLQDGLADLFTKGLSRHDLIQAGARLPGVQISDLLAGTIEWAQTIGKPLNAPMADAFTVRCVSLHTVRDDNMPSKQRTIETVLPVRLFDGKSGAGRHRVHFIVTAAPKGKRTIIDVGFSARVRWQRPGLGGFFRTRRIQPPRRDFVHDHWPVEPFEVKEKILFF